MTANRVALREVERRGRRVDDRHVRRALIVRREDVSTLRHACANGLEVVWPDAIVVRAGVALRSRDESFRLQRGEGLGSTEDAVLRERCRRDAGDAPDALEQRTCQGRQSLTVLSRRRGIDAHDQQAISREAGVHVRERARAAYEHAGTHQQCQGQRDLTDDEQLPDAQATRCAEQAARESAAVRAKRRRELNACRAQRRDDAEQQRP